MTQLYASRGFLTINGYEALDLKSATLKITESLTRVDTMTRNRRTSGYRYGNRSIQISAVFDIREDSPGLDPAIGDPSADIGMVFVAGGERYFAKGCRASDLSLDTSVGDATKSVNFEALDVVNENGVAVNANISL